MCRRCCKDWASSTFMPPLKPAVPVCRFLPTQDNGAETNGDHFELAAPEVQQEVRSRAAFCHENPA